MSNENKRKIGLKSAGKNNPSSKSVAQYDLDGNLIKIWDYCKEAAIALGNPQKLVRLLLVPEVVEKRPMVTFGNILMKRGDGV